MAKQELICTMISFEVLICPRDLYWTNNKLPLPKGCQYHYNNEFYNLLKKHLPVKLRKAVSVDFIKTDTKYKRCPIFGVFVDTEHPYRMEAIDKIHEIEHNVDIRVKL